MLVEELLTAQTADGNDVAATGKSAASWPSIIAGAFVAAGASVILLTLGSGLGFAAAPWTARGVSASDFTTSTAIWLIVTQWISAALGGYIAGRLRTRWIGTHSHEVFFRDTAHGLVTWAVATVAVAALLGSSIATTTGSANTGIGANDPGENPAAAIYGIDKLFRPAAVGAGSAASPAMDARSEAAHILANALSTGNVPDADRSYLADLIAARTGISRSDAQTRVGDWVTGLTQAEARAKLAAETARMALAQGAIYMALSLLVGAFIASVCAALGGRLRDEHP